MIPPVIEKWHELVTSKNIEILDEILADDARMHSPVVHTVQEGKAITKMYLTGAAMILGNDKFKYVREVYDKGFAMLEFETEIEDIFINGIDMIYWNDENKITDFKVMVRPLKAINILHKKMGEALQSFMSGKA